ncbi:MAG: hypothetical protein R3F62_27440 [Planctomycetota bacterium]
MSRPLELGLTLVLAAGCGLAQELPEGYGERWITPHPAWRFSPGRALETCAPDGVELAAGEYVLVPAIGLRGLEVDLAPASDGSNLSPAQRAEVYLFEDPDPQLLQTNSRSSQTTPDLQGPPQGRAILGVRLPTQARVLPGGAVLLRADLGLRPARGWFAVRAGGPIEVALRGLDLEQLPESWERVERELRLAREPNAPWPEVWRPADTLPGGDVASFFAEQAVLLPWAPAEDDALARRARIAGFELGSHLVRPVNPNHTRIAAWPVQPGAVSFKDSPLEGTVWGRPYALLDEPWTGTVRGPAVLRVRVRATWSHRAAPPSAVARFDVQVGATLQRCERLVRPDLRATSELLDTEDAVQALAERGIEDVVLSNWSEVRVLVPPGRHDVRVVAQTPLLWAAVGELHRTLQLGQPAPLSELPAAEELGGTPSHRALAALSQELRGAYPDALAAYTALAADLERAPRLAEGFARETAALEAATAAVASEAAASGEAGSDPADPSSSAAVESLTPGDGSGALAAVDSSTSGDVDSGLGPALSPDAAAVGSAALGALGSASGGALGSALSTAAPEPLPRGLSAIAALDSATRVRFRAWALTRRADLAERLDDPDALAAARRELQAHVVRHLAEDDPWQARALGVALRLWLDHELVPPPMAWAQAGLASRHLSPELYALVFRALAAQPDAGRQRLPIAPAEPTDTRALRALIHQTQLAAQRRASARYARLPRTHPNTSSARRFLLPVRYAPADVEPDPRAVASWQLAQTAIRATALLARATPLTLEAKSDEPLSLLAFGEGWRGGLGLEVEGVPRGELTHVSPWAPVELGLDGELGSRVDAGDPIRLEASPFNPEPWLLIRGRMTPRTSDAFFCDPVTLDRLELDGQGQEFLEARLSEGDALSSLRLTLGVEVPAPWPDLDLPFALEVEEQPRRELRLLYVRGEARRPDVLPGPVVRAEFVVPAGSRTVRVVGPYACPSFAAVEEQRFGQPPLVLPAGEGSFEVAPSGVQRALSRPVDVLGHLETLRALSARLGGTSRGELDRDEAALEALDVAPKLLALGLLERGLILLELDQSLRARRDLIRALELAPTSDRELQVRLHTVLAALAFELEDERHLRSHVRAALDGGGRSVELCLLAAAASAGRDVLLARSWLVRAGELRGDAPPSDLELLLRRRVGLQVAREPEDVYLRRLFALEDWGRARGLSQEALYAGLLDEAQALRAAAAELSAQGRRSRAGHLLRLAVGCDHARADLGLGHWPPAHGALDPASERWPLPGHAIDRRPPEVWLEGGDDRWRVDLLRAGDPSLLFRVQGPTTLVLSVRPAHLLGQDGRPRRHVAPLRYALHGLPAGSLTRTVLSSRPSLVVRPSEPVRAGSGSDAPELVVGSGDVWRVHVPAGRHRLEVEPLSGTGFFELEEEIGRSAGPSPADLAPRHAPPAPPRLLRLEAREPLEASLERRVAELTAAVDPHPALVTQLGDDLLFSALTGGPDEHVLTALAVYALLGDAPHPDSDHAEEHMSLALGLTQARSVDLGPLLGEFRRLRLARGANREPNLSAALFEPPGTESLILEGRTTRWRFASSVPAGLALELAANVESPLPEDRAQVNVWLDGRLVHAGPLSLGERVVLPLADATQRASVRLLTDPPYPDAGMRVHARLLRREGNGAWEPYDHVSVERAYAARGQSLALPLRGPALLELERWDEGILARREVDLWEPAANRLPQRSYLPVVRRGITPRVELPPEGFVRLLRREVDPEPLEFMRAALRAAEPPGPARVVRPLAPRGFGLPRPEEPDFARPTAWDHEFVLEPFALGVLRERQDRRQADEELVRDTLELGVHLHHLHPVRRHRELHQRFPLYTRVSLSTVLPDGQEPVGRAELRLRAYFAQVPNLSLRVTTWGVVQEARGGSQKAWQGEVSLRYAQPLRWRFMTIFESEVGFWTSSVSRRRLSRLQGDVYRDVSSTYRADHRLWLDLGLRLRWTPTQDLWVEALGRYRTNESFRIQDAERLTLGLRARAHHEWLFGEAGWLHLHRFEDADRARSDDEDLVYAELGVETWASSWAWLRLNVGGRWAFQSSALTASVALELRFSRPGTRHRAVDPQLTRFARYQDAVYPWPR